MSDPTVVSAPKRIRLDCIATIAGALVGEFVVALRDKSGDLLGYDYGPDPYYPGLSRCRPPVGPYGCPQVANDFPSHTAPPVEQALDADAASH
jgi:hypothetical protein